MSAPELAGHVDVLAHLRGLAPSLVPSLRRVADKILTDPRAASALTITELADAADTSQTTVLRLCRQLGVRGYRDLRVALAADHGREEGRAGPRVVGSDIGRHDSLDDIISKITFADGAAIAETARLIDRAALAAIIDAVVAAIESGRRVDIFGVGASAFVAMDLQQKLHRIGAVAFSWADQHAGLTAAALLRPGDVAIGISHTGATRDTVETITEARRNGATTAALTSVPRSRLAGLVDHLLVTAARETTFRSGAMGSRIAALSVVDMLFVGVAQRRYDETIAAVQSTRRAIAIRRFDDSAATGGEER